MSFLDGSFNRGFGDFSFPAVSSIVPGDNPVNMYPSPWAGQTPVATSPLTPAPAPVMTDSTDTPWYTTAIGTGLDVFKTVLGYKLAENQVNHGQFPTAIGQTGNIAGTANVATSQQLGALSGVLGSPIVWLILLAVAFLLIAKR